jgi:hypothetical protein
MSNSAGPGEDDIFRVLIVTQGLWGQRIADNVGSFHPGNWVVNRWAAAPALPLIVDYPEDYIPPQLPAADLVLALGETAAVAQLIPDICRLAGARAVIAPIDRNESLPPGLVKQLRGWLSEMGVDVVFPKPFCSLTETTVNAPPLTESYDNPLIRRFARSFGRPRFTASVDSDRKISVALVERHAACGCARHVAHGLAGCPVADAEFQAGMLHHHYPCLASMNQDLDYQDTLMHISGNLVREAVRAEIEDYLDVTYLRPHGRVEP